MPEIGKKSRSIPFASSHRRHATFTSMKYPARYLIALALLACALAWWWNSPPPEPSYKGKPLSQWMQSGHGASDPDFALVIGQLHSTGLPAVTWLGYTAEHGHSKHVEVGAFRGVLAKFRGRVIGSEWPAGYDERSIAMLLLGCMGAEAEPAIPALLRVLEDESYYLAEGAALALHRIGSGSWPAVKDHLLHGPNLARCALFNAMPVRLNPKGTVSEEDVTTVFNLLTHALHDPEPNIRRNAASSFANAIPFSGDASIRGSLVDETAAALWPLPDESNLEVRNAKEAVRSYYHNTIVETVPRLTALITSPDEEKRKFARSVLEQLGATSTNVGAP
jgi:hypothetical protein